MLGSTQAERGETAQELASCWAWIAPAIDAGKGPDRNAELRAENLVKLAGQKPRYGYRRLSFSFTCRKLASSGDIHVSYVKFQHTSRNPWLRQGAGSILRLTA